MFEYSYKSSEFYFQSGCTISWNFGSCKFVWRTTGWIPTNFVIRSIAFFSLLLTSALLSSAQVSLNWAQNLYPTPLLSYTSQSILIDESGNIYSCGAFAGTADMDPGSGVSTLVSQGFSDIYIRKQNAAGDLIWARRIGGSQNDLPSSICMDEHHRLYLTGSFTNTVDFDPGPGTATLNTGSVANADIFILKMDSAGNHLWSCGMGSPNFHDYGTSITSDQQGHVLLTGYFRETADFDPGANVFNLTSTGSPNIFVLALDSLKNFQWAYANLVTATNMSPVIETNNLQEVYVAGSFKNSYDFDPGAGNLLLTSVGADDIFIQKFTNTGQLIWARSIGGTGNDKVGSIRLDSGGNLYISGSFQSSMDADPGTGVSMLNGHGGEDVFLLKWNANGNHVFSTSFGGNSEDRSNGLFVDTTGNAFLTGYFIGTMDMDPGPATVNVTSNGLTDAFVSKFDMNGQFRWGRSIGSVSYDYGYAIIGDDSGHVVGLGAYRGQADFDPGGAVFCPDTNQSTYLFKWGQCQVDASVIVSGMTLTAAMGGATYQWLQCLGGTYSPIPGATNLSYSAAANGDYALAITQGACTDTGACIKVGTVGLENYSGTPGIYLYPNPTNDQVFVEGLDTGELTLFDLMGRKCFVKSFVKEPIQFSTESFPPGPYLVVIQSENILFKGKLMIE